MAAFCAANVKNMSGFIPNDSDSVHAVAAESFRQSPGTCYKAFVVALKDGVRHVRADR
jgi:hypothetical protein